jgi:hypothetical protein
MIFIIRSKVRPLIEGDTWKPADHPSHPQPACESFSQVGALYGGRHDLIPMPKSANAPGRPYVLLTCDELAPGYGCLLAILSYSNARIKS